MDNNPNPKPAYHALLIDLDNCPRQINNLPASIEQFERIIKALFKTRADHNPKDFLKELENRAIVEISGSGRVNYPEIKAPQDESKNDGELPF